MQATLLEELTTSLQERMTGTSKKEPPRLLLSVDLAKRPHPLQQQHQKLKVVLQERELQRLLASQPRRLVQRLQPLARLLKRSSSLPLRNLLPLLLQLLPRVRNLQPEVRKLLSQPQLAKRAVQALPTR